MLCCIIATNGKHQWVPKDIIEAAEKHAKVWCFVFISSDNILYLCIILYALFKTVGSVIAG
jgi:predicted AAA+ superfamily ATPase